MPDQLQLRGGTTTEHNSFTGAAREVTVDTTKKTLVVHDGSQAGGTPLMKESGATAASSVTIGTGGVERLKLTSSEVVFNETSTDTDFRIEGNGEANLFKVDAGNDRIGIGTNSPSQLLHLKQTGANALLLVERDSGGIGFLEAQASKFVLGSSNNNAVHIVQNSADALTIDTSKNVGIGTTSPIGKLQVVNGNVVLSDSYNFQFGQNADRACISGVSGASGRLQIDVNNSEKMRIDASGNVGIGTTSPRDKLEIKGANGGYSFRVNAEAQFVKLLSSDNTGGTQGGFRFATDNAATEVERMRIDNNGNVGIGTTSPSYPLSVVTSSGKSSIEIKSLGTGANDDVFLRMLTAESNKDCFIHFGDADDADVGKIRYNHGSNFMSFTTNAAERMRVTSSGNVGIGLTNPSSLLELSGGGNTAISINTGNNSGDNATINFGDSDDGDVGYLNYDHGTNALQVGVGASQFASLGPSQTIDLFQNRNIIQRFGSPTITVANNANKQFTITGLGYGWAKLQLAFYGEGHQCNVEVTLGGLMASGGTFYTHTVIANTSSAQVDVAFGQNQTTFVVTISNNVSNGGSIHGTALFTGQGSTHPSCAVS